eukprot:841284-Amphidinium_carterae.1
MRAPIAGRAVIPGADGLDQTRFTSSLVQSGVAKTCQQVYSSSNTQIWLQVERPIDNDVKIATVVNQVKGPLRNYLLPNMDVVTSFDDVRKKNIDCFQPTYDVPMRRASHRARHDEACLEYRAWH